MVEHTFIEWSLAVLFILILGCAASLKSARREVKLVFGEVRPIGWKELSYGPRLGLRMPESIASKLQVTDGRLLLVFLSMSCYDCRSVALGIPSLTEILQDLSIIIVSGEEYSNYRKLTKSRVVQYYADAELIRELNFSVTPYAVFFENQVPVRKGIVNSLEQICLLIEPDSFEKFADV